MLGPFCCLLVMFSSPTWDTGPPRPHTSPLQLASLVFTSPGCLPLLVDNLAPCLGLKISLETRRGALRLGSTLLLATCVAKKKGGPTAGQCLAWEKVLVEEQGDGHGGRPPKIRLWHSPVHLAASTLPFCSQGCT